jgi:hypothetical protein
MQPSLPLRFPPLQSLLEYWLSKRAGAPMPLRTAIDPLDIPLLLPHLMLTEPVESGADFRYRLVGTAVVEAAGIDFTGRRQSELLAPGAYRDYVLGLSRAVMEERRPLYSESSYRALRLSDRWTARLMLPLASATGGVGYILTGQVFGTRSDSAAGTPIVTAEDFEPGIRFMLEPDGLGTTKR